MKLIDKDTSICEAKVRKCPFCPMVDLKELESRTEYQRKRFCRGPLNTQDLIPSTVSYQRYSLSDDFIESTVYRILRLMSEALKHEAIKVRKD